MANPLPATTPSLLAIRWGTQALGAAVLATTTWQAAMLLVALPRYFAAPTFWLELGVCLPLWLPCWVGSTALLRGHPSGYRALYLAAGLCLAGWAVIFCPPLRRLLGLPRCG
jgi:hypothetical protein